MTKKRVLALSVAVLLIMGLLAGCVGAGSNTARMDADTALTDVSEPSTPPPSPPEPEESPSPPPTPSPSPVPTPDPNPSSWAIGPVNTAIAHGLVPEHLQYDYTQPITHEEFSDLVVVFYENIMGEEISDLEEFNDTVGIDLQELEGSNPAPDDPITREQAAVILANLAEAVGQPLPIVDATYLRRQ